MNDHIEKPIKSAKLYETLIRWISRDVAEKIARSFCTSPAPASHRQEKDFPELEGVDATVGLSHVNGDRNLYI